MASRRTSGSHLSPFDLSGVGIGLGIYRPRRPSYTFATQVQRQRSESYRYAVRKSGSDCEEPTDFIEGIIQRKTRKESYIRATREEEEMASELHDVKEAMKRVEDDEEEVGSPKLPSSPIILINDRDIDDVTMEVRSINHNFNHKEPNDSKNGKSRFSLPNSVSEDHIQELKEVVEKKRYSPKLQKRSDNHSPNIENKVQIELPYKSYDDECTDDSVFATDAPDAGDEVITPGSGDETTLSSPLRKLTMKKNLILLCISFILIFNAFRAIQNLQSSLNNSDNLGIIAMTFVHGTMCVTCLWAPVLINNFTAKWTLVIGMLSFILWIVANFFPRFYTLIPSGMIAGVGKGILWAAESSYILKLSFDYSRVTKEGLEKEMFRFHGIFLACFQTTHIWGNLISSLVLHISKTNYEHEIELNQAFSSFDYDSNYSTYEYPSQRPSCGVLYSCQANTVSGMLLVKLPTCTFYFLKFFFSDSKY